MTIPHEVRIKISWGLILLAALPGVMILAAVLLGHSKPEQPEPEFQWHPRPYRSVGDDELLQSFSPLQKPPPGVDMDAQTELKQAGPCLPCQLPQYANSQRPNYINGERVVAWGTTYDVPQRQPVATPKPAAQQPPKPLIMPAPGGQLTMPAVRNVSNTGGNTGERPAGKQFQTLLFVDQSYQGQQLKSWFESDPNLVRFKNRTDFQIFTPGNRLYQARYTNVISPTQFPAIVIQDSSGGHLHAAGGSMIPGTSAELWSDIEKGYHLYKQAKSGLMQMTGAIKTRGYNWDAAISPGMQLNAADCPDGICPLPNDDQTWRPLDRLRPDRDGGGLFDGGGQRSLFLWAGGGEIVQIGVLILGAALVFYIIHKRTK